MPKSYWSLLVLFLLSSLSFAEEDLRENKAYAKDDYRAYSVYDTRFTPAVKKQLHKRAIAHRVGRYIWTYTEEFAERFGMPKRWIGGKDFKGALALAYRHEGYVLKNCGWGGNWQSCSNTNFSCILDVYVDSKASIPWDSTAKLGVSPIKKIGSAHQLSTVYSTKVTRKQDLEFRSNQAKKDWEYKRTRQSGAGIGIDWVSWDHRFKSDGFGQGLSGDAVEFHRGIFEGVDLIVIERMCNFASSGDPEMQIWFAKAEGYDEWFKKNNPTLEKWQTHKDRKSQYKIYPGGDFMKRVKEFDSQQRGFVDFIRKQFKSDTQIK